MAKQVQRGALHDVLHGQPAIPTWAQGRDLSQELRPTLSQLSNRIVQELARLAALIQNRDEMVMAAQQEITHASITPAAKRQLGEALWKGVKHSGTKER